MAKEKKSSTVTQGTAFETSWDIDRLCNIKTSTWKSTRYDLFFYGLVYGLRPMMCVELGTLSGYSAYNIASALKDLGFGHLYCYDLWEGYKYNHVPMSEAKKNLEGLPVSLYQENCELVYAHYPQESVDFLYVDISNDGYTYEKILGDWYYPLSESSVVVMEGGSEARDEVEWMKKFKKKPIRKALESKFINDHYDFKVFSYFPGITVFRKKEIR